MKILSVLLSLFLLGISLSGQNLEITLIIEGDEHDNQEFAELVKSEINALMRNRQEITINSVFTGSDADNISSEIERAYASDADILIALGLQPSAAVSMRESFVKPTIAGFILDTELQGLSIAEGGVSGIDNFTFIVSPFDIKRDLELFSQIYPYEKLTIVTEFGLQRGYPLLEAVFNGMVPYCPCDIMHVTGDVDRDLASIPAETDALYLLPLFNVPVQGVQGFLNGVTQRKIPTFSLFGRSMTNLGVMASAAPDNFMPTYARRIAIDVLKISENQNASTLPVYIENVEEDFIINMAVVEALDIFPDFDLMNQATLINLEQAVTDNKMTLQSMILEALEKNLEYQIASKDLDISTQHVKSAKSSYLPSIDAAASTGIADQNTFVVAGSDDEIRPGANSVELNASQLLFSEGALANIKIQQILKSQQEEVVKQSALDIVLNSTQAYLSYLQTKSLVRIQNENVAVTKQNLDISKTKNKLGYSGISDVYRLESQLAQNNIDLNQSLAGLKQTIFNINSILNRPISQPLDGADVLLSDPVMMTSNGDLENMISNQYELNRFTDFLVERAFETLPQIKQIEYGIMAQERQLKAGQRSLFLPQLAAAASYGKSLGYYNLDDGIELSKSPTWNVGIRASIPLYQGGSRRIDNEISKLSIEQLRLQKLSAKQSFEMLIRSNMETLSASYSQMELSNISAVAALENFKIVQDLYRQGQADIITLIDAQNASLQAELSATNAVYQFMSDFFAVERYAGQFYFLMSQEEKQSFSDNLLNYLIKKTIIHE